MTDTFEQRMRKRMENPEIREGFEDQEEEMENRAIALRKMVLTRDAQRHLETLLAGHEVCPCCHGNRQSCGCKIEEWGIFEVCMTHDEKVCDP